MLHLNEMAITNHLRDSSLHRPFKFHIYSVLDSTNQYLKTLKKPIDKQQIDVCCAEAQTHGRGRFDRTWYSPFSENIYCSSRWFFNCHVSQLSGLSLIVSLAMVSALKKHHIEAIMIKWPNDLIWEGKKLAGILIEMNTENSPFIEVIIGIGLNVNSDTESHPNLNKPWCSLFNITNKHWNRNQLIASLLIALDHYVKRFMEKGCSDFLNEWAALDYLANQLISVSQPSGMLHGKAHGIDDTGALRLLDKDGTVHLLSFGDTSLSS